MKKEFSVEEKLEAISFVFQGETARSVSNRLCITGTGKLIRFFDFLL